MSIRYVLTVIEDEEIWAPAIYCDHCRKQIIGMGNILWNPTATAPEPLFAHKGTCDRTIEQAHPEFLYWEELDRWLKHLTNNTVKPGHRVRPVVTIKENAS